MFYIPGQHFQHFVLGLKKEARQSPAWVSSLDEANKCHFVLTGATQAETEGGTGRSRETYDLKAGGWVGDWMSQRLHFQLMLTQSIMQREACQCLSFPAVPEWLCCLLPLQGSHPLSRSSSRARPVEGNPGKLQYTSLEDDPKREASSLSLCLATVLDLLMNAKALIKPVLTIKQAPNCLLKST